MLGMQETECIALLCKAPKVLLDYTLIVLDSKFIATQLGIFFVGLI
jgi:hypothetical protein